MRGTPKTTGPILPPHADELQPDGMIKTLYQMVRDLWAEQFGAPGKVGQAEEVRELARDVADLKAAVTDQGMKIKDLQDAPGKEAQAKVSGAQSQKQDFWKLLVAATIGGGISQGWQVAGKAFSNWLAVHHW